MCMCALPGGNDYARFSCVQVRRWRSVPHGASAASGAARYAHLKTKRDTVRVRFFALFTHCQARTPEYTTRRPRNQDSQT